MGLKVHGDGLLVKRLQRTGETTSREALNAVRHGADNIAKLAVRMAPVDEGNLEKAIRVEDESERDASNRKVIRVGVDESMPIPGRPGKSVGDYATRIHEGSYKLGKKSREKQSSDPSVAVGRKYLQRAAEKLEPQIKKAVADALRQHIR